MCDLCPQIVAYRLDGNRNLIPIYEEEPELPESEPADAVEDRMAKILARHSALGLSSEAPLA
ncbi:MAG: hypothetical protein EOP61_18955 [Sphingomonadales bacterium]|nr:MAG: hypothetical protein EOP61_18955 [Sphingomonadales bacterium]